jgi:hypothetical protein
MANHVLSLEVPTVMNPCIMKLFDTSVYATNPTMPITCPTLNVTVPGYGYSTEITGLKMDNFVLYSQLTLTACDLQLQTVDCGSSYVNIPDGIYIIKYSVSPNSTVYVEYNHLRITDALNAINDLLCCLDLQACDPQGPVKEKLKEMSIDR